MKNEISNLKRMLAERALAVCEHLLPAGKAMSGEWCVGSVGGETGQSLRVAIKGNKAGIWADFAADGRGDLVDLWCAVHQQTLVEALGDIRVWLGVERPAFMNDNQRREYARPSKPDCRIPEAMSPVMMYLTEGRNLPVEVITKYKIGEQGDSIIFPFLRDGQLIMAKSRRAVDGAHPVPTASGCEPILFGWQAVDDNTRELYITEGEIDAMSLAAYGYDAVSVPFGGGGGGKQNWIENEYDRLDRFETIYLCLDGDEPGVQAVEEIAKRLGRHRCQVVVLPYKDANDCLVNGVAPDKMAAAIKAAHSMDPAQLARPLDFLDEVMELFYPSGGEEPGYSLPYENLRGKIRFRQAELSIWTGGAGDGKSQLLSHAQVNWLNEGARICLSSLEMKSPTTLRRMVKQASGVDGDLTKPMITAAMYWLNEGLFIYNVVGKSGLADILDVFDYARAKYGCDVFIIDSLLRLGLSGDDYEGQEKAVYTMVDWVIDRDVHLHLVAHSRKGDASRGAQAPVTVDIKGAMEIGANAFNILSIFRNTALEEKQAVLRDRQEIGETLTDKEQDTLAAAPVVLRVAKQRNGEWEGKIGLWFSRKSFCYRSSRDSESPRRYVPIDDLASFEDSLQVNEAVT
ncbi:MAG: toprim domain-containing protein [Gammaproteobacteria bacterium]